MKASPHTVLWLQPGAPPKPPFGAPCNGCSLCCLIAPCPLGMLVSRRRTGSCDALRWDEARQRYQCGLIASPAEVTGWKSPWLLQAVRRVAERQIAAGSGCDADIAVSSIGIDAIE